MYVGTPAFLTALRNSSAVIEPIKKVGKKFQ